MCVVCVKMRISESLAAYLSTSKAVSFRFLCKCRTTHAIIHSLHSSSLPSHHPLSLPSPLLPPLIPSPPIIPSPLPSSPLFSPHPLPSPLPYFTPSSHPLPSPLPHPKSSRLCITTHGHFLRVCLTWFTDYLDWITSLDIQTMSTHSPIFQVRASNEDNEYIHVHIKGP